MTDKENNGLLMKELSIEEKAKRYDEAIERVKQLSKELTVDDIVQQIFPELVKSKDERIRTKLIEFFVGYTTDKEWWGSITEKDILAWLEKQYEQKPWSEKDEKYLNDAIDACKAQYGNMSYTADWLKNLKDRIQLQTIWKPSDEQMETLKLSTYCPSERMSKVLFELYEDLKKLRKEYGYNR